MCSIFVLRFPPLPYFVYARRDSSGKTVVLIAKSQKPHLKAYAGVHRTTTSRCRFFWSESSSTSILGEKRRLDRPPVCEPLLLIMLLYGRSSISSKLQ